MMVAEFDATESKNGSTAHEAANFQDMVTRDSHSDETTDGNRGHS